LHNTSSREFKKHFKPADFMPGADNSDIETRVHELIKLGYNPAAACAIATSRQSKEQQLFLVNKATGSAGVKAAATAGRRSVPVVKKRA
jgi:hypothetical protein